MKLKDRMEYTIDKLRRNRIMKQAINRGCDWDGDLLFYVSPIRKKVTKYYVNFSSNTIIRLKK